MDVSGKKLLTDWKLVVNLEKKVMPFLSIFNVESSDSGSGIVSHEITRKDVPILGKYGRKMVPHPMCYKMKEGDEYCTAVFFVL